MPAASTIPAFDAFLAGRSAAPDFETFRASRRRAPVTVNAGDAPAAMTPDRLSGPPEAAPVPERPETLEAQLGALAGGRRPAVLVTPGELPPPLPEGHAATETGKGVFIHDPRKVAPEEVRARAATSTHGALLGHVEPKTPESSAVVVASDGAGRELQSSYVSPAGAPAQVAELQRQFPGARVEVGGRETEARVLRQRAGGGSAQSAVPDFDTFVAGRRGAQPRRAPEPETPSKVWTLEEAAGVRGWFRERFGRELPVSAEGLSDFHRRKGLDHAEAFDIALHPDSEEGRAVVGYFKERGYPFMAYTDGGPYSPHIHAGFRSRGLNVPAQPAGAPDFDQFVAGRGENRARDFSTPEPPPSVPEPRRTSVTSTVIENADDARQAERPPQQVVTTRGEAPAFEVAIGPDDTPLAVRRRVLEAVADRANLQGDARTQFVNSWLEVGGKYGALDIPDEQFQELKRAGRAAVQVDPGAFSRMGEQFAALSGEVAGGAVSRELALRAEVEREVAAEVERWRSGQRGNMNLAPAFVLDPERFMADEVERRFGERRSEVAEVERVFGSLKPEDHQRLARTVEQYVASPRVARGVLEGFVGGFGAGKVQMLAGGQRAAADVAAGVGLEDASAALRAWSEENQKDALVAALAVEMADKQSPLTADEKAAKFASAVVPDLIFLAAGTTALGSVPVLGRAALPVAFGSQAGLTSYGAGASPEDAAVEAAKGAGIGVVFKLTHGAPARVKLPSVAGGSFAVRSVAGETPSESLPGVVSDTAFAALPFVPGAARAAASRVPSFAEFVESRPSLRAFDDAVISMFGPSGDRPVPADPLRAAMARPRYTAGENLERGAEFLFGLLNVPKALKASLDWSGIGRQGLPQILAHPKRVRAALSAARRATVSPEEYADMAESIRRHPQYSRWRNAGVFFSSTEGVPEEVFAGANVAGRIPLVGRGVKASERAYNATLDLLRARAAEQYFAEIDAQPGGATAAAERAAAELVNLSTGRGVVPLLDRSEAGRKVVTFLNLPFFSPRNMAGRFNLVSPFRFLRNASDPETRVVAKIQAKEAVRGLGTLALTAGLLDLVPGVDVGWNPYGREFGKVRVGKKTFDITGGMSNTVRFVAQLSDSFFKLSNGQSVEEKQAPVALAKRFLRSQLSPIPAVGVDYQTGTKYGGQPFDKSEVPADLLLPFMLADLYEGWTGYGGSTATDIYEGKPFKSGDTPGAGLFGAVTSAPAFLGFPVGTYESREQASDLATHGGANSYEGADPDALKELRRLGVRFKRLSKDYGFEGPTGDSIKLNGESVVLPKDARDKLEREVYAETLRVVGEAVRAPGYASFASDSDRRKHLEHLAGEARKRTLNAFRYDARKKDIEKREELQKRLERMGSNDTRPLTRKL